MDFLVEVTTVSVVFLSCLLVFGEETVVCPLPSKSTLEARVLVKSVNVLLDVTRTVAHCMDELAQDQRLGLGLVFAESDNLINRRVHPRVHVHCVGIDVGFVVDGGRRVGALSSATPSVTYPAW